MPSTRRPRRTSPAPGAPLGSLVQRPVAAPACTACGSQSVTAIAMTLTDGTPVTFVSCHDCEHRSWRQQDTSLSFATVLDKTRKSA